MIDLGLGLVGTIVVYGVVGAIALYLGRFVYELAADGDGVRDALEDSSEWFGAFAGAAVGVGALAVVEGVEVVSLVVEFVGGLALGFVAAALTGLAAALAEGIVSLSGQAVVGIAVALVGVAMLSSRWLDL